MKADFYKDLEQLFQKMYQKIPVGIAQVSLDFTVVQANEAYCRMLGYSQAHIIGKHLKDITHPESIEENLLKQSQLARGEIDSFQMEKTFIHQDGHAVYGVLNANLIRDEQGNPVYFLGTVEDISKQRWMQEILREKDERFREIFMNSCVGKSLTLPDGTLHMVNRAFCDLLGYDVEELKAKDFEEITHPDDLEDSQKCVRWLLSGERTRCRLEKRYLKKDNKCIWTDVNVTIQRDLDGKPLHFITEILDISERKRAESAMVESEKKFRSIFENMAAACCLDEVIYKDGKAVDYRILDVNPAYEKITGLSRKQVAGELASELYGEEDIPFLEVYSRVAETGIPETFETYFPPLKKYLAVSASCPEHGKFSTSFTDISNRLQVDAEKQRNEARLRSLVNVLQHQFETVQDFLDFALNEAIALTGSKIGYIYHYDEDRREFVLNTWSRDVMKECDVINPPSSYELDKIGIWGEAVRQRQPVVINNFAVDNSQKKGYSEGNIHLKRFMTIPVFIGDRIVGVVGMVNKPLDYDEVDVLQLSLLMDAVWKVVDQKTAEDALKRIQWMLTKKPITREADNGLLRGGSYGDLTVLNEGGLILQSVGKDLLASIVDEYLDMLETSSAVYELNGDYVYGIFSSNWCRLMDNASRALCGTDDNTEALASGLWLCHESCWKQCSQKAIEQGMPVEIHCSGGIKLYAVPIWAGGMVVGAINFGFSDPPRDPAKLKALAERYQVEYSILEAESKKYDTRPDYIIEMAKHRLSSSARLIGEIVERNQGERRIEHLNRVLLSIRDINQLIVMEKDPQVLIKKGCELLVENRGYAAAVIILTNEEGDPDSYVQAGMDDSFAILEADLLKGKLPECCEWVRDSDDVKLISDQRSRCDDCPIDISCSASDTLIVRLTHGDRRLGYLSAALEKGLGSDSEEQSLFKEMAGDLALALYTIQMEMASKQAEKARLSLEQQLMQAQKMEAIGRLAGGIAHDFNNIIQTISGYSSLIQETVPEKSDLSDFAQEISKSSDRAAGLTRQLLAFARKQTISPHVLDLNDTVAGMIKMLNRLIGEDIDLVWKPGKISASIVMDPVQIDQILVNLLVNARDAIGGVGKVTIETGSAVFDDDYCREHLGFEPGRFMMLGVSDDGCGMEKDTMINIFEPFFSTKLPGQGTGLGLSTVYGIVRQNNGFINVYSEPGHGSTFRLYFPAVLSDVKDTDREKLPQKSPRGSETILLVEDEIPLLKLAKRLVEKLGYTVLIANRPNEAIKHTREYPGKIHLIMTDVVMPEMTGRKLYDEISIIRPGIKCLYMSGYTANVIAHRGVLDEGVNFLQKPFSLADLAGTLRKVFDTN